MVPVASVATSGVASRDVASEERPCHIKLRAAWQPSVRNTFIEIEPQTPIEDGGFVRSRSLPCLSSLRGDDCQEQGFLEKAGPYLMASKDDAQTCKSFLDLNPPGDSGDSSPSTPKRAVSRWPSTFFTPSPRQRSRSFSDVLELTPEPLKFPDLSDCPLVLSDAKVSGTWGIAAADFEGHSFGAGFLSFKQGSRLLRLPSPREDRMQLAWAFGRTEEGKEGWFPPECWRGEAESQSPPERCVLVPVLPLAVRTAQEDLEDLDELQQLQPMRHQPPPLPPPANESSFSSTPPLAMLSTEQMLAALLKASTSLMQPATSPEAPAPASVVRSALSACAPSFHPAVATSVAAEASLTQPSVAAEQRKLPINLSVWLPDAHKKVAKPATVAGARATVTVAQQARATPARAQHFQNDAWVAAYQAGQQSVAAAFQAGQQSMYQLASQLALQGESRRQATNSCSSMQPRMEKGVVRQSQQFDQQARPCLLKGSDRPVVLSLRWPKTQEVIGCVALQRFVEAQVFAVAAVQDAIQLMPLAVRMLSDCGATLVLPPGPPGAKIARKLKTILNGKNISAVTGPVVALLPGEDQSALPVGKVAASSSFLAATSHRAGVVQPVAAATTQRQGLNDHRTFTTL
eukprot:TRINITY_DN5008_c0_g1_i1.p1 TRINITY_DN5008_c0_g1~~TRINITY_DN5008_c0_g1_i1.p1  ORF type:complete len:687 (-),score=97.25 TRINITY_DN5008_c0_g1_i1:409-2298(-)